MDKSHCWAIKMQKQYCVFIFIFTCVILKCSCTIDMVDYLMYNNTDDWHRFPEQIMVIPSVSRIQCIGYCHKNVDCLSVNYNKQLLICELNDYYPQVSSTTYVSEVGWKAYYPKCKYEDITYKIGFLCSCLLLSINNKQ